MSEVYVHENEQETTKKALYLPRTSGGNVPYTTQHLWFVLLSISRLIAKISFLEKATTQSPG